jgi:hypothetical protein
LSGKSLFIIVEVKSDFRHGHIGEIRTTTRKGELLGWRGGQKPTAPPPFLRTTEDGAVFGWKIYKVIAAFGRDNFVLGN